MEFMGFTDQNTKYLLDTIDFLFALYCLFFFFTSTPNYVKRKKKRVSCQKGLFLDRVFISPRTEKALAAAVTKLMAPMARVACRHGEANTDLIKGFQN